jgi:hypothetical protein
VVVPADLPTLPFKVPFLLSGPDAKTFLAEAYYQHTHAYFSSFQVQGLAIPLQSSATGSAALAAASGA